MADDLEYQATLDTEQRTMLRALRRIDGPDDDSTVPGLTRVLVYLRFWAGLTTARAARSLGLSTRAAVLRQRFALTQLRRHIEDLEDSSVGNDPTSTSVLCRWRDRLEQETMADNESSPGQTEDF